MQFSKITGITLMILGALGILFFSSLFLVYAINQKYFLSDVIQGRFILPSDLQNLVMRLFSTNPTNDMANLSESSVFGVNLINGVPFVSQSSAKDMADFAFALSICFVVVSLALFFTSISSIFSPLSLGVVMVLSFLLLTLGLVGSIFTNYNDLSMISTDSLPGIATLLSPIAGIFVGGIFQVIYFSLRKKYHKN